MPGCGCLRNQLCGIGYGGELPKRTPSFTSAKGARRNIRYGRFAQLAQEGKMGRDVRHTWSCIAAGPERNCTVAPLAGGKNATRVKQNVCQFYYLRLA